MLDDQLEDSQLAADQQSPLLADQIQQIAPANLGGPATPNEQIQPAPSDRSPSVSARDRFHGELSLRAQVLEIIKWVLIGLLVLAGLVLYLLPSSFTVYLNGVLPVISGVVFGIVGFAVGKDSK
jgi:hypothetical protein